MRGTVSGKWVISVSGGQVPIGAHPVVVGNELLDDGGQRDLEVVLGRGMGGREQKVALGGAESDGRSVMGSAFLSTRGPGGGA